MRESTTGNIDKKSEELLADSQAITAANARLEAVKASLNAALGSVKDASLRQQIESSLQEIAGMNFTSEADINANLGKVEAAARVEAGASGTQMLEDAGSAIGFMAAAGFALSPEAAQSLSHMKVTPELKEAFSKFASSVENAAGKITMGAMGEEALVDKTHSGVTKNEKEAQSLGMKA